MLRWGSLVIVVTMALFALTLAHDLGGDDVLPCGCGKKMKTDSLQQPPQDMRQGLASTMKWVVHGGAQVTADGSSWMSKDVVIEADQTPNVPWRGQFEGVDAALRFFTLLRQNLFEDLVAEDENEDEDEDGDQGLLWASAATSSHGFIVHWKPTQNQVQDQNPSQIRRVECGDAWFIAQGDPQTGQLSRLTLQHTHPLGCAAAFRSRAQVAFDTAFGAFFRMDYKAFRESFAPDVVLTWHGDAPLGTVLHGRDGVSEFIKTRVQIFLQTSVEFDPILADDTSASYYVVFRPLTIKETGQVFAHVRGMLVINIDPESGLIKTYQMTLLDREGANVSAAVIQSLRKQK